MNLKNTVARWLPLPYVVSERLGLVQKSLIPSAAWKFWGLRRNARLQAEEAYEKVGWVYGSVRAIARNASQVPFYAATAGRDREGKTTIKRLPDSHVASRILKRPNEEEDWSGIIESSVIHKQLRGESLWEFDGVLPGDNGKTRPANIYVRPPTWIWKVDVENDRYARFHMRVPTLGEQVVIPGDMAMFLKFYNPRDPWRGMAPMTAAYQAADTYYAASLVNARFFDNGAIPSLVLKLDKDTGLDKMSQAQADQLRSEMEILYGGYDNAHKIAVLGPGQSFDKIGSEMKDMNFSELMKTTKEEILAVFGVPPIELGFVESANRANSDSQRRLFWEEIIIPDIEDTCSLMNRKLAPRFGPDVFFVADYSQVPALRRDMKAAAEGVIPFVDCGAYTINEVRRDYLDKEPVEWGDEYWHSSLEVPTGEAQAVMTPDANSKPGGAAQDDEDDIGNKNLEPAKMRRLLGEWKNATLSRIRDGAREPLRAFPSGREAQRASKRFGISKRTAYALARAVHIEIAVGWNSNSPERGAAEIFERTIDLLPAGASGAEEKRNGDEL